MVARSDCHTSICYQVSLRIVPDQVLNVVCLALVQHLRASFDALHFTNIIKVYLTPDLL
jgi:hypothetical protein